MRRVVLCLTFLSIAAPALAQQQDPIPRFVLDARGAFALIKADTKTAETLRVTEADLSSHGMGLAGGAHAYLLRRSTFAFGVGGEIVLVDGSNESIGLDGKPLGPETHTQLHSVSVQLSANFGHRQGWSYLTGGIGPMAFDTYLANALPDRPRVMTINFGFGARWFNTEHVAFSLDLRFYLAQPTLQTDIVGGRDRQSLMVMSAGIAIK